MIKFNQIVDYIPKVFRKTPKTNYKLLEKTEHIPIDSLPNNAFIPEGTNSYTYVKIGRKDNPNFYREVTSYYQDKKVVFRQITGSDINPIKRTYTYSCCDAVHDLPSKNIFVRHIKTEEFDKNNMEWVTKQEEDIHKMTMLGHYDAKKKAHPSKIHINKNVYTQTDNGTQIAATITEYPANLGMEKQSDKKELGLEILLGKQDKPEILSFSQTTNVDFPAHDKFLAYRFLLGEQKLISLAKHYLRERGLGKLNIPVRIAPKEVAENSSGHFNPTNGEILYKKAYKYVHPVKAAAHEPEHAYQYSLIGRSGKGYTDYERKCRQELGELKSLEEYKNAMEYNIASENYPKLTDAEDLSKNMNYVRNKLEVGAKNREAEAFEEYNEGRKELMDQFKYVPDTICF